MFIDVLFGFIWNWLKAFPCKRGWHKWDMYRGYEQFEPHHTAKCKRCGAKYNG